MATKVAHNITERRWRSSDVRLNENAGFDTLMLSDSVLAGLKRSGFRVPSPIQMEAIPLGRSGADVIMQAKSGTGKTCAFSVVALDGVEELPRPQVLILSPTRELAVQIYEVIQAIGNNIPKLKCGCFIGGMSLEDDKFNIRNCQIIIGTPGRVRQLITLQMLMIEHIRLIILDEADKLVEPCQHSDVRWILSVVPDDRQIIAASATYPPDLKNLCAKHMNKPRTVSLASEVAALEGVTQYYCMTEFHPMKSMNYKNKFRALWKILERIKFSQCFIFCNLIASIEGLCMDLNKKKFPTTSMSSAMTQEERLSSFAHFKEYRAKILVTSDLTARGIDIEKVDLVINFDLPYKVATYVHRIGRAGRYGTKGVAITLVLKSDLQLLKDFELQTCGSIFKLPDPVPRDILNYVPDVPEQSDISVEMDANHNGTKFEDSHPTQSSVPESELNGASGHSNSKEFMLSDDPMVQQELESLQEIPEPCLPEGPKPSLLNQEAESVQPETKFCKNKNASAWTELLIKERPKPIEKRTIQPIDLAGDFQMPLENDNENDPFPVRDLIKSKTKKSTKRKLRDVPNDTKHLNSDDDDENLNACLAAEADLGHSLQFSKEISDFPEAISASVTVTKINANFEPQESVIAIDESNLSPEGVNSESDSHINFEPQESAVAIDESNLSPEGVNSENNSHINETQQNKQSCEELQVSGACSSSSIETESAECFQSYSSTISGLFNSQGTSHNQNLMYSSLVDNFKNFQLNPSELGSNNMTANVEKPCAENIGRYLHVKRETFWNELSKKYVSHQHAVNQLSKVQPPKVQSKRNLLKKPVSSLGDNEFDVCSDRSKNAGSDDEKTEYELQNASVARVTALTHNLKLNAAVTHKKSIDQNKSNVQSFLQKKLSELEERKADNKPASAMYIVEKAEDKTKSEDSFQETPGLQIHCLGMKSPRSERQKADNRELGVNGESEGKIHTTMKISLFQKKSENTDKSDITANKAKGETDYTVQVTESPQQPNQDTKITIPKQANSGMQPQLIFKSSRNHDSSSDSESSSSCSSDGEHPDETAQPSAPSDVPNSSGTSSTTCKKRRYIPQNLKYFVMLDDYSKSMQKTSESESAMNCNELNTGTRPKDVTIPKQPYSDKDYPQESSSDINSAEVDPSMTLRKLLAMDRSKMRDSSVTSSARPKSSISESNDSRISSQDTVRRRFKSNESTTTGRRSSKMHRHNHSSDTESDEASSSESCDSECGIKYKWQYICKSCVSAMGHNPCFYYNPPGFHIGGRQKPQHRGFTGYHPQFPTPMPQNMREFNSHFFYPTISNVRNSYFQPPPVYPSYGYPSQFYHT